MGIFTGLNGFFVSGSRILFAMGRARILPKAFAALHPKYGTPYVGILFTCAVCLLAPWFGRQALVWVVDMSAIGVTIAYFYTCFAAYKMFHWLPNNKSGHVRAYMLKIIAPGRKLLALLGAICSIIFLGLLLFPGSPAALGIQSLIALCIWMVMGFGFYLFKGKEINKITKENLDYYIIGNKVIAENNKIISG